MKGKTSKRLPIRKRVRIIVLLTTIIAIVAATITGIISMHAILNSNEGVLLGQLENNLKNVVDEKVISANAMLEHYEKYIEFFSDYTEKIYANKEEIMKSGKKIFPPHDTHEYAMARGFASEDIKASDVMDEILLYSDLEYILEPISKENQELITTMYMGTASGLLVSYDRWSYLSLPEEGKSEIYYNYFDSNWYSKGIETDGVFFTDLYTDSQGRGLTITAASRFCDPEGNPLGVCGADFDITALYDSMIDTNLGSGTNSFAFDTEGNIISPDAENKSAAEITGLTEDEIAGIISQGEGMLEKNNTLYIFSRIDRVGWTICSSIDMNIIQDRVNESNRPILYIVLIFIALAAVFVIAAVLFANRAAKNITQPIEQLEEDMEIIAGGNLDHRATAVRNDEIGDAAEKLNEMVDKMKNTMNELSSTQEYADSMKRLARVDALTGIRNKTAYDQEIRVIEKETAEGNDQYGLMMIDMNGLKTINDLYGHDKGDIAIKKLSGIICEAFPHSPVFRVGGDEFVVILKHRSYEEADKLIAGFEKMIEERSSGEDLKPWERVTAAAGYALYDKNLDGCPENVLARADKCMYKRKSELKGV